MGQSDASRGGRGRIAGGLVGAALLVLLGLAPPAAAEPTGTGQQPSPPTPPDETVLPPADADDVSIVPTDQRSDDPAADDPDSDGSDGSDGLDGSGGVDLGDIDPLAATGWALLAVLSLTATAVAATRLARTLHIWRSPASVRASGFRPASEPATSFSLLVPAAPGQLGLGRTLDRLAALDHPAVEVLAVVGRGDAENRGAALAAAARRPDRVRLVVVDVHVGRRRAAALDGAVADCHGEVVGVFQPGDEVSAQLLRYVDGCFTADGADAVQGGVIPVVRRWRWFTVRHVVDRYFWYRSRLQFHAQQRFMPLDETTVFVRADVLCAAGGWHRQSVAPGCDLGVRLSVNGAQVVARYDPALVTRTDAADSMRALLRDEARWVRGHLQVLRSGVWRRLPTRRQRLLARSMLVRPLVEPVIGLAATVAAVGTVATGAPVALTLLALAPVVPATVALGVELAGLSDLHHLHSQRILARDRAYLLASAVPYQLLQALAALGALAAELGVRARRRVNVPVAPPGARRLDQAGRSHPVNRSGPFDPLHPPEPLDPSSRVGTARPSNGREHTPPSVVDLSADSHEFQDHGASP
ncbi:MAG: glycosyltransferase [Acidimicrobiales bacterium]